MYVICKKTKQNCQCLGLILRSKSVEGFKVRRVCLFVCAQDSDSQSSLSICL